MRTSGPGQSPFLLLDVINILDQSNIPYAVVGALAASFYGVVRASMDADAVISFHGHDASSQTLITHLNKAGFHVVRNQGDADDPISGVISVTDTHHNKVDLLTGIQKMPAEVFQRTVTADFSGEKLKFVGVEDFIAMKVFAGGPKDIEDVLGVLGVSSEKIDFTLLRKITAIYGKDELKTLESILKNRRYTAFQKNI